jgi:hypothetical protein
LGLVASASARRGHIDGKNGNATVAAALANTARLDQDFMGHPPAAR